MLPQGVLGFQYESEPSTSGLTSLGGLPLYLELIQASGLAAAIREQVRLVSAQGWMDLQMVLALIFLNLAGGDCLADLGRLDADRERREGDELARRRGELEDTRQVHQRQIDG